MDQGLDGRDAQRERERERAGVVEVEWAACVEERRNCSINHGRRPTARLSGPGACVSHSCYNTIIWRTESRTHLSKQTRPSTEHSRKSSNVRGIPSRPDDQLRWVLIVRSQV